MPVRGAPLPRSSMRLNPSHTLLPLVQRCVRVCAHDLPVGVSILVTAVQADHARPRAVFVAMTAFLLPTYDGSAFCQYCRVPVCFSDFLGVQGETRLEHVLRRKLRLEHPVEVRFVVALECDDALKRALDEERVARITRDHIEYEQYYSFWPYTI